MHLVRALQSCCPQKVPWDSAWEALGLYHVGGLSRPGWSLVQLWNGVPEGRSALVALT